MNTRRALMWAAAVPLFGQKPAPKKGGEGDEDVSPAEDLMREHGVLKRILLIYREGINRIDGKREFPPDVIASSAKLIRSFVEDYHETLEEDYLFPRFRKANRLVDLVDTLYQQHQAGRALTQRTIQLATAAAIKDANQRGNLRDALYQFVRMYEPHEAREDTVLFPAFRKIVSKHEYDSLGEEFEKKENELFHGDGFERTSMQLRGWRSSSGFTISPSSRRRSSRRGRGRVLRVESGGLKPAAD